MYRLETIRSLEQALAAEKRRYADECAQQCEEQRVAMWKIHCEGLIAGSIARNPKSSADQKLAAEFIASGFDCYKMRALDVVRRCAEAGHPGACLRLVRTLNYPGDRAETAETARLIRLGLASNPGRFFLGTRDGLSWDYPQTDAVEALRGIGRALEALAKMGR
jgi:hypothetical protein